jgi:hypothetical protein
MTCGIFSHAPLSIVASPNEKTAERAMCLDAIYGQRDLAMDMKKSSDQKVFKKWMSTTRCYPALSLDENAECSSMMTL